MENWIRKIKHFQLAVFLACRILPREIFISMRQISFAGLTNFKYQLVECINMRYRHTFNIFLASNNEVLSIWIIIVRKKVSMEKENTC